MPYSNSEAFDETITSKLAVQYQEVLKLVGEDETREGLLKTPHRIAKAMQFMTSGYSQDAVGVINSAKFHEDVSEMILVKDIEFYSMCEHHMLPFFGKAHVGYIPNGEITGLSKIARIVDIFSRRLQVQERLTHQILDTMVQALKPMGAGVIVEAEHLCMMMRGVKKQNSKTITSAFAGQFLKNETRTEFLNLCKS